MLYLPAALAIAFALLAFKTARGSYIPGRVAMAVIIAALALENAATALKILLV